MTEKNDFYSESAKADNLFVYVPRKNVGLGSTPWDSIDEAGRKLKEGTREEKQEALRLLGAISFVLESIRGLSVVAKRSGTSEQEINEMLKKIASVGEKAGVGWGLESGQVLMSEELHKVLAELGAKRESVSLEWISKTLERVKGIIPADALTAHELASWLPLPEKTAYVALLSVVFQEHGIDIPGKYELNKNDCFDYCMLMAAVAKGLPYLEEYLERDNSLIAIENERRRGTAEYFWKGQTFNGSFVRGGSWFGPGPGPDDHWGIEAIQNGKPVVIHWYGEAITVTEHEKYAKRVGGINCTILLADKPSEKKPEKLSV